MTRRERRHGRDRESHLSDTAQRAFLRRSPDGQPGQADTAAQASSSRALVPENESTSNGEHEDTNVDQPHNQRCEDVSLEEAIQRAFDSETPPPPNADLLHSFFE